MYVFLLAGSEVVLSAVVLATCNFLFIKRKPAAPADKLESLAATDDAHAEACSKPGDLSEEEKGAREVQEKEMMMKKDAIKESKEEEEEREKEEVDEVRPKSVAVDSQEVERFLKEPLQNGEMSASPETCL